MSYTPSILRETGGGEYLVVGPVVDGQYLKRSGSVIVGDIPAGGPGGGDPSYSPGSFTVATETGRLIITRMKLTGSQRATIQGTGRLRIS